MIHFFPFGHSFGQILTVVLITQTNTIQMFTTTGTMNFIDIEG